MPKFYYRAREKSGAMVMGSIDANDSWQASKALRQRDLSPITVSSFGWAAILYKSKSILRDALVRVSIEEKLVFINQMDTGFSVGIPILEVLINIHRELQNTHLKEAVATIIEDIKQGKSLHAAFEKHPRIFDSTFVGLIKIGESSGKLDETLGRLAQLTEQKSQNQAKIKSAMFYPKMVLGFLGLVILAVVYFIIPKIQTFLSGLGADLPPITKMFFGVSMFFVSYWYLVMASGVLIAYGYRRYASSPQGRTTIDRALLKLPKLGELLLQIELNSFCVLFNLLLESGIPIFEAFDIVKMSLRNKLVIDEIDRCKREVAKGKSLGGALQESSVFPATFTGLLAMGEASGKLPNVLQRLGKYYQDQIDYRLNNLSKIIEPLLLFVIFGLVLALALAVMLPIWKVSSALKGR